MRITRLELDRIGPFEAASIDIPAPEGDARGELVIFTGPNGSGKSVILRALACAAQRPCAASALMPPLQDVLERLRAPGAARITIEDDGERLRTTLDASGIAWPEGAESSPVAARLDALSVSAEGQPTRLSWAAFAYQARLATPVIATAGPAPIRAPALGGALSFGAFAPASEALGQWLANVEHESEQASVAARVPGAEASLRLAHDKHSGIERIEDALSEVSGRAIRVDFPFGERAPRLLVDGEPIPLALLGEGTRGTVAWLADLLVRLERAPWLQEDISPLDQDFWLLLDGIDEGLHPALASRTLPVVRRLFPNARLYVATHSPFLVASAGGGTIFSLRPDSRGRITAAVPARRLEPGQSLEWVAEDLFGAETGFLDPATRAAIAAHRLDINRLRRKASLDGRGWEALLARRAKLLELNEEVRSVVAMQEAPVRALIEARLAASKPPEGEGP